MGYIPKALEKGYSEHPGLHAVLTTCLRFRPFWTVCVLPAAAFCQQARIMSAYKFVLCAVASLDAPPKPFICKRACSGV